MWDIERACLRRICLCRATIKVRMEGE
jgi:hypothetical protein